MEGDDGFKALKHLGFRISLTGGKQNTAARPETRKSGEVGEGRQNDATDNAGSMPFLSSGQTGATAAAATRLITIATPITMPSCGLLNQNDDTPPTTTAQRITVQRTGLTTFEQPPRAGISPT